MHSHVQYPNTDINLYNNTHLIQYTDDYCTHQRPPEDEVVRFRKPQGQVNYIKTNKVIDIRRMWIHKTEGKLRKHWY